MEGPRFSVVAVGARELHGTLMGLIGYADDRWIAAGAGARWDAFGG